jgi:hypothetical protein
MWVKLVSDVRKELMWTHAAAFAEADGESAGECAASEVAFGLGDVPALVVFDELQPATSAAPVQLSATTARQARPTDRLGTLDLVIVSSVMLPMHTPRPTRRPHPERTMSGT